MSATMPRTGTSQRRLVRVLFVLLFPLLILAVYMLLVERQGFVESRRCMYGAIAAYPALLWGSFRFMFGKKGARGGDPKLTIPPFVVALVPLTYAFVTARSLPANRTPSGWSAKVPRYPGVLLQQENCSDSECAASFQATIVTNEGAKHIDRYDLALVSAKVPAQGWPATCPSMGNKCRIYSVAGMRLIECLAEKDTVVHVRYGMQPCPDGESERDAGSSY